MDYQTDYAKSSRASCRGCQKGIGKGELRLAMLVQSNFRDGKDPHWHHFTCFFSKPRGLSNTAHLEGFGALRPADQKAIQEKVGGAPGASAAGASPAKKKGGKKPAADPATKKFTKQSEVFWKIKDLVEPNLKIDHLREMLTLNKVWFKGGEIFNTLLPRVVKLIQFGVPPLCTECGTENRRLRFNEDTGKWECRATLEYSKCPFNADPASITTTPFELLQIEIDEAAKNGARKKAKQALADCFTSLSKFSSKPAVPVGKPKCAENEQGERKIFSGWVFAHCRAAESEFNDVRKEVEDNGGIWSDEVNAQISFLLEDPNKFSKKHPMVAAAIKCKVPVLRESFVKHSIINNCMMDSSAYSLTDRRKNERAKSLEEMENMELDNAVEVIPEGCRVAVQGTAWKTLGVNARVVDQGGDEVYHAVLSQADIQTGRNAFYKLQVIRFNNRYHVSREWGRTGTTIMNNKLSDPTALFSAISEFEQLFLEKTGNKWSERKKFEKKPGLFEYIESRFVEVKSKKDAKTMAKGSKTLHKRVVDLIELIYDTELMKSALIEMDIDLQKFPLGALTEAHVEKGYKTLSEISDVLNGVTTSRDEEHKKQQLMTLSNKFYHLIPHSFVGAIPSIDSLEKLNQKVKLIDALRDMEVATRFLNETEEAETEEKSEADVKYDLLKTKLRPIEVHGRDWDRLDSWVQNTKKLGWNDWGTLKLVDAFEVHREGEKERFEGLGGTLDNHKLLWHGSGTTNYCGILSQGLRIAPPEAPASGYRFGKGVYFADAISKSANYCRTAGSDDMLIMACEVALGTEYEAYRDEYMEKPKKGCNSTHAMGSIVPDPKCDLVTFEDITIPIGTCKKNGVRSSCDANEFIVYNVAQVRIRYLLRLTVNPSKSLPPVGKVISPVGVNLTPPSGLRLKTEEPDAETMDVDTPSPEKRQREENKQEETKLDTNESKEEEKDDGKEQKDSSEEEQKVEDDKEQKDEDEEEKKDEEEKAPKTKRARKTTPKKKATAKKAPVGRKNSRASKKVPAKDIAAKENVTNENVVDIPTGISAREERARRRAQR